MLLAVGELRQRGELLGELFGGELLGLATGGELLGASCCGRAVTSCWGRAAGGELMESAKAS